MKLALLTSFLVVAPLVSAQGVEPQLLMALKDTFDQMCTNGSREACRQRVDLGALLFKQGWCTRQGGHWHRCDPGAALDTRNGFEKE
jgi:hypothetical protein